MTDTLFALIQNGTSVPVASVPCLPEETFRQVLIRRAAKEERQILSFFALPEAEGYKLFAVLGAPGEKRFEITSSCIGKTFRSMAVEAPAFQLFEREIAEQYPEISLTGHPWLKPVRKPDETEFFKMDGEAVHEVAVGPIHAGVIEPGHFRFQCMGEDVYFLEIALGYQHRGIEKMMTGLLNNRFIHLAETASGDASCAASAAWSCVVEALSDTPVTGDTAKIRAIALELERIACHTGDLGALAGDVAFLPTASFCGRIRGEYLNMTAELCGNRFGRGISVPGGCRIALEKERAQKILEWIRRVKPELYQAVDLLFNSPTVLDRFESTGTVSKEDASRLGLVGMAGRASGLARDARQDYPLPGCENLSPAMADVPVSGDVLSRARVRYAEIKASHDFLEKVLAEIPAEGLAASSASDLRLKADHIAVAVTEAWRGPLCYTAVTDGSGAFRRVKIVDPSFHNWTGLAWALRGEQISHFPICNKSFNLSYCGFDL